MDMLPAAEQALIADIDALRARFPQTQDLYREVCTLMFFRHGVTPTANRLYQLVRKGSMSAPAQALNLFWTQLREKSRIDLGQPGLPPEVVKSAGELAATLWTTALAAAQESLAALRDEAKFALDETQAIAQREIGAARSEAGDARRERDTLAATHDRLRDAADADQREIAALRAELRSVQTAAQADIADLRQRQGKLEGALEAVTAARDHAQGQLDDTRLRLEAALASAAGTGQPARAPATKTGAASPARIKAETMPVARARRRATRSDS